MPDLIADRQLYKPVIHPCGQSVAYFVEDDESHHSDIWLLEEDPVKEFDWKENMSVTLFKNVRANVLGIRNNYEPN